MTRIDIAKLIKENARLKSEIARLEVENRDLVDENKHARRHSADNTGKRGEKYLRDLLGAKTGLRADCDLCVNGWRIEVKTSKLNGNGVGTKYKKWAWTNLLGHGDQKSYDYLVLLGPPESRFKGEYYKDKNPKSPFVIFHVPRRLAIEIAKATPKPPFYLGTCPAKVRTNNLRRKVWKCEMTPEELVSFYSKRPRGRKAKA